MALRPHIRIAEPERFSPAALEALRAIGDVELRACARGELRAALEACDVFWFRLAHRIGAEQLGARPRCRVLATPVTGLDHIDLEACAARGVRVVSLRGETEFLRSVRATAEMTVALALALLRHIPAAAASVRAGAWQRDLFPGRELHGKRAGLVGVGRLGTIVAQLFTAFGMEVSGYDPRPELPPGVRRVADLGQLFAESDVISIHASYHPGTHHLIGREVLARARQGAVLVNTARGGIVDEAALLDALERRRLAGAALDVLEGEPDVPADHPLIEAASRRDDLLIVPHLGGNTFESFEKTELFLARRVAEALEAPP
ncbi:MAG TPA: NAD(P)-dependent oxidoreductase [Kofleriaceae bacterium]|nr:NAD(P)-dependent oxidoreductase [Kofleriaceae bacterium]